MRREGLRAPPYRSIALFESVGKGLCAILLLGASAVSSVLGEFRRRDAEFAEVAQRKTVFPTPLFGLGLGWAPYSGSRAVRDEADGNRYE